MNPSQPSLFDQPTTVNSFVNTTNVSGSELIKCEEKAYKQEGIILDWFDRNPFRLMAPSELHSLLFPSNTPLTSVRRAVSLLTKKGHLIKTNQTIISPYKSKEHKWGLKSLK